MVSLTRRERTLYPSTRQEGSGMWSLRDEMNRLFDDFLPGFAEGRICWPTAYQAAGREFMPSVDVSENDGLVTVSAELPGMTDQDIKVELDEDTITISGEKKEEKEDEKCGFCWRESSYGSFRRDVPLPASVDADKAKASFKNGRLLVSMPKNEESKKKRKALNLSCE